MPGGNFVDTHLIDYSWKSDNVSCQTGLKLRHFDVYGYLGIPCTIIWHFKLINTSLIINYFYKLKWPKYLKFYKNKKQLSVVCYLIRTKIVTFLLLFHLIYRPWVQVEGLYQAFLAKILKVYRKLLREKEHKNIYTENNAVSSEINKAWWLDARFSYKQLLYKKLYWYFPENLLDSNCGIKLL